MRFSFAFLVPLSVVASACADRPPPASPPAPTPRAAEHEAAPPPSAEVARSKKAYVRRNMALLGCHASFKSTGDALADVVAMGRGCADVSGMHPLADPVTSRAPRQSLPLQAAAGHCYRVFAVAGAGVHDLDLRVVDSAGGVATQDETEGATPVLAEAGALCFSEADAATLEVVALGEGTYALQIWTDEAAPAK